MKWVGGAPRRQKYCAEMKTLKRSLTLLVGSGALTGLNYLFHLVTARGLTPTEYGVLSGWLAGVFLLSVPGQVLQLVASRGPMRPAPWPDKGRIETLGLLVLLLGCGLSHGGPLPWLVGLSGGLALWLGHQRGVELWRRRAGAVSGHYLTEAGVKLGLVGGWLWLGRLTPLTTVASVVGSMLLVGCGWAWWSRKTVASQPPAGGRITRGEVLGLGAYLLGLTWVTNVDVLLVTLNDAALGGQYSVVQKVALVVFYAWQMVGQQWYSEGDKVTRSMLLGGVAGWLGLTVVAVGGSWALGEWVVGWAFGGEYLGLVGWLPALVWSYSCLGAVAVLGGVALRRRQWCGLWGMGGLMLGQVALYAVYDVTDPRLWGGLVVGSTLGVGLGLLLTIWERGARKT